MLRAYVSIFSHSGESNLKKRKEKKKEISFNIQVYAVYAFIIELCSVERTISIGKLKRIKIYKSNVCNAYVWKSEKLDGKSHARHYIEGVKIYIYIKREREKRYRSETGGDQL